jgi:hypothetical protein
LKEEIVIFSIPSIPPFKFVWQWIGRMMLPF